MKNVSKIAVFLVSLIFLISCSQTIENDLTITNTNIINVENGEVLYSMDISINDGQISAIVKHKNNIQYKGKIVDGKDKYVIPGLWDMHAHSWWAYQDFFPLLLANGVTGVREMFGNPVAIRNIKEGLKSGNIIGPDVISAGRILDGKPASQPGSDEASTPEEGREIVRMQKQEGADFIKVYGKLDRDTYFAIADECSKQNIPMVGHIPLKVTLKEAISVNHKSLEHFHGMDGFCHPHYDEFSESLQNGRGNYIMSDSLKKILKGYGISSPDKWGIAALSFDHNNFEEERISELVQLLVQSDTWVSPTMTIQKGQYQRRYNPNYDPSVLNRYMPDNVTYNYYVKDTLKTKKDSIRFDENMKYYKFQLDVLKKLFNGGAKILAGTDYPVRFAYPGFSLHDELQIYVEDLGANPLQALQTATINPAIFFNKEDELGTVEVGKKANLVLLNGNPLENIKNTQSIVSVVLRGVHYSSDSLNMTMEAVATKHGKKKIREILKPIILSDGMSSAVKKYKELKLKHPNDYNFNEFQLITLGDDLFYSNNTSEAIEILNFNIIEFPNSYFSYENLSKYYLVLDQKDEAIKALQKYVELGGTRTDLLKLENEN